MGKYVIGIDLGTTNSAVSIYENGQPKILENSLGKRTTPSIVAKKKDKKTGEESWPVGESAKRQAVVNPLNTITGVKRLIGRRFDDPEVAKMKELASYKIVEGHNADGTPNGDAWVEVDGKAMAPAEISAKVLIELKKAVEKYLGEEVTQAVITVPAYFNDSQRKATKDAGAIAGLEVLRIINEPTAAALAYGMDKKTNGTVVVYDLGGGTFDVSVLEVTNDKDTGLMVEVRATNGDTFLGGENFDERIMGYLIEALKEETGLDLKTNKDMRALQTLKEASEKAKIELSLQETSDINLPFIGKDDDGEVINWEHTLTRKKLEELVGDLVAKTIGPCEKALADAGLKISDIDEVILVGGQTRMPQVIETVKGLFKKEPRKDVNPDEIVSMGASIQGAIIDGKVENVLLLDVIPLSIGIRTLGDVMTILIERNSTIPTTYITPDKETFTTSEDNQRNVGVKIYQGERPKASDNKLLGEFTLDLPPALKGVPQIALTLDIDADGVLNVEAKDIKTGRAQKITVKANGGLSDEDVTRMLKDAEAHADSDRAFKEAQLAGINADVLLKEVVQDESEEWFQTAPEDLKEAFHSTVKELTEAVSRKDTPVMIEKTQRLQEIRTAIGEAFNNAAQAQNAEKTPAAEETDETPSAEEKAPEPKAKKKPAAKKGEDPAV